MIDYIQISLNGSDLHNRKTCMYIYNINIPERVTMSVALRPFLENADVRLLRSKVGSGMSLFAELRLAVVASLRPSCTLQDGPPNFCMHNKIYD